MSPAGDSRTMFQPSAEGSKVCAYNQTRERFLSVDVEAADFSPAVLSARLPELTPGCSLGLWIVPFRGISPTSVRVPIDLLYLSANGVVLYAVDSFPISQVPCSGATAASVVALPAQTIVSTGTRPGDRLLLCAPEEMKRRFQQIAEAKSRGEGEGGAVSGQANDSADNQAEQKAGGNVLLWVDRRPSAGIENPMVVGVPPNIADAPRIDPASVVEKPSAPDAVAPPATAEPSLEQPWQQRVKTPKSWLQRLLAPEPADPRKSPREELSWLGAYFFTGGKPVAHGVRDISATGVYVFTEERWYPGTVLRITLTDLRQPTPDRSITAHAKVVRAGNDGVGLEFVLNGDKNSRRGDASSIDGQVAGVEPAQIELFLHRARNGSR
jgi:hypothetical protein